DLLRSVQSFCNEFYRSDRKPGLTTDFFTTLLDTRRLVISPPRVRWHGRWYPYQLDAKPLKRFHTSFVPGLERDCDQQLVSVAFADLLLHVRFTSLSLHLDFSHPPRLCTQLGAGTNPLRDRKTRLKTENSRPNNYHTINFIFTIVGPYPYKLERV
ncbi:hypothetical protein C8P63_110136, partial [Melghirimyces profundicolus]